MLQAAVHSKPLFDGMKDHPELFTYLPWRPFTSIEDLNNVHLQYFESNQGWVWLVVHDKTRATTADPDGPLAGVMGYINSSESNLVTEIGAVIVLPPFQRTHVASNAVGVMLNYALNVPLGDFKSPPGTTTGPGLGLRRVVWQANFLNKPSIRLAERMGFQHEGVARWHMVLPIGSPEVACNGKARRDGDPKRDQIGRNTAVMSLCWDDWEDGGRVRVGEIIRREK